MNFRFVVSTTMSGSPAPRPPARPVEDRFTRPPPGFGPIPGIQRALPRYCFRKVNIFIEEQGLSTCLLMWLMRIGGHVMRIGKYMRMANPGCGPMVSLINLFSPELLHRMSCQVQMSALAGSPPTGHSQLSLGMDM